jgi:hypothetical protein
MLLGMGRPDSRIISKSEEFALEIEERLVDEDVRPHEWVRESMDVLNDLLMLGRAANHVANDVAKLADLRKLHDHELAFVAAVLNHADLTLARIHSMLENRGVIPGFTIERRT